MALPMNAWLIVGAALLLAAAPAAAVEQPLVEMSDRERDVYRQRLERQGPGTDLLYGAQWLDRLAGRGGFVVTPLEGRQAALRDLRHCLKIRHEGAVCRLGSG